MCWPPRDCSFREDHVLEALGRPARVHLICRCGSRKPIDIQCGGSSAAELHLPEDVLGAAHRDVRHGGISLHLEAKLREEGLLVRVEILRRPGLECGDGPSFSLPRLHSVQPPRAKRNQPAMMFTELASHLVALVVLHDGAFGALFPEFSSFEVAKGNSVVLPNVIVVFVRIHGSIP